jgi:hypothetical protein
LDDTRLGLGTFVALKGACGKTTTTTERDREREFLDYFFKNGFEKKHLGYSLLN